jgi:hypothetical protein
MTSPLSPATRALKYFERRVPGVPLRSTPGRGPQLSISAGVRDFMPSSVPRTNNPPLLTASCFLLTAYRLLLCAFCLLPFTVYCLLFTPALNCPSLKQRSAFIRHAVIRTGSGSDQREAQPEITLTISHTDHNPLNLRAVRATSASVPICEALFVQSPLNGFCLSPQICIVDSDKRFRVQPLGCLRSSKVPALIHTGALARCYR